MDPKRVALVVALFACDGAPTGPDPGELRARFDLQTLGTVPYPPDNQPQAERIALGRLLFFDPILGGERDVACGTCHHPDFEFADGRQFGAGVSGIGIGPSRTLSASAASGNPISETPRNSPTVLNAGFNEVNSMPSHLAPMFWDGRAVGLEGQAMRPIASRNEMRGDAYPGSEQEAAAVAVDSVLQRLKAIPEYVQLFGAAFPGDSQPITVSGLGRAVAAYERELVTPDSPFDRFVRGDDDALTPTQLQGLELFFTNARCSTCHRGQMLSNFQFLVTGVPQVGTGAAATPGDDTGREEHTGNPDDRYRFRVPSIRNVELTGPYMHDGVFSTLEEVVRFYNEGSQPRHSAVTDQMLEVILRTPLGLTDAEVNAVVEFLKGFTQPVSSLDPQLVSVPATVPSGLTPVFGVSAQGRQGRQGRQ